MNYAVTSVSEKDFTKAGISWLSSLFDFSNYDGEIIFIDFGLSESNKSKLLNNGIIVLDQVDNSVPASLKNFVESNKGIYSYWNCNCVFQDDINLLFELCNNKILYTENSGFYAFDSIYFNLIQSLYDLCSFLEKEQEDFFEYYKQAVLVENIWNFKNITNLSDIQGKLCFNGNVQNVLNFDKQQKTFQGRNVLFWEKHKDCYEFYLNKFKKLKF
ncbi:MAG: hypothetical protein EKK64_06200 [Neisseriaceae bacterium]|nr:MAG: hypothetical protein EKK64_06200 [Neisseriaceae bacterium]